VNLIYFSGVMNNIRIKPLAISAQIFSYTRGGRSEEAYNIAAGIPIPTISR
jgi:hypothetical protein